ncbi:MAG: hypothetical protein LQ341_002355, partial [Variospora aurantia]
GIGPYVFKYEMDDNEEIIRKRADNDLCVLNTFRTGTGPGPDALAQPAGQNGPLAATAPESSASYSEQLSPRVTTRSSDSY